MATRRRDRMFPPDGWFWVAVLVVLGGLACAPAFQGAWAYDDWPAIVQNAAIRHFGTAWRAMAHGGTPVAGRPVLALSFALDFALSGTAPWSYHLTNAVLHGLAALALFGIVRRTLGRRGAPAGTAAAAAALVAVVWTVHPLQTEAVTYVAQRAESLMGCLYLGTLYTFVRAVDAPRPARWLGASVLACLLGMATKEVMVSAPLVVWLYDRTFVSGTFAAAWRRRRFYYGALAATWLVLAVLVAANPTRGGTAGFAGAATWWEYAVVQTRALVLYLKLTVWPHPLVFDYGVDHLPLASVTVACVAATAALLIATIVAVGRRTAVGFAAAAALLILAPTTSVLPIVTEPVAEHRMYLPLAALAALGVIGAWRLLGRRVALLALAAAAAFVVLTARRDRDYSSESRLWADTVAKAPENARARYNLGRLLAQAGDLAGARRQYEAALALQPNLASVRSNLSDVLLRLGDVGGAAREGAAAVRLAPRLAEAHNNLANALLLGGDAAAAVAEYKAALRLEPHNADLRGNLATALIRLNRWADAVREYEAALRLAPASPRLHFALGNTFARLGRFDDAARAYQSALALQPGFTAARENLQRVRALAAAAARR